MNLPEDVFLYEEVSGSQRLVITFSHLKGKNFTCYNALQDVPVNRLFVRDPTNSWYNGPVSGCWNDADGLLEKLSTVTRQFDPANIICIGSSMGGYAAILFGCKLNVGKVVAFVPQMVLDSRLPNNPHARHNIQYRDVYRAIVAAKNTSIDILFGSEDLCDIYNLIRAKQYKSIKLHAIYGSEHDLLRYLLLHGVFSDIIQGYALHGSLNTKLPLCSLHEDNHAMQLVHKSVEAYYFHSPAEAIPFLENLVEYFPQWSAAHFYLGMARARIDDTSGAAEALQHAANRMTQNFKVFYELAMVLKKLGKYRNSELALLRAIQMEPKKANLYYQLGIIKLLQKNLREALKAQEAALRLDQNFAGAEYQLGLIKKKLREYTQSAKHFQKALLLGDKSPNLKRHLDAALFHSSVHSALSNGQTQQSSATV